ncbi:MAG TPA: hypothetical protein VF712_15030 [Thermoleophilaceae bacterium]|jgi:hypothetical protein
MPGENPLVDLDEKVSFASTTPRVVRTQEAGRLIGFGCSGEEEAAHQQLEGFLQQARENPGMDQGEFEGQVRSMLGQLEQSILSSQQQRASEASGG